MVPEIGHELILALEGTPQQKRSYRRGLPWQTHTRAANETQISRADTFALQTPIVP
jgi:hypothetical protein